MKPKSQTRHFAKTLFFAFSLGAPSAHAASSLWNADADGNWATTTNPPWSAGSPGSTSILNSTDVATFGTALTANRIVTVDTNRNIGGITFSNTSAFGYTLSGADILLSSGGTIQTTGAGMAHTDTISSGVVIQGATTGTANFTAASTVNTRLLVIGGNVSGVATLGNTTALALKGANIGANTVAGNISDGSAGGKLSVTKSEVGTWVLSGNNSYTGGTFINGGLLNLGSANAIGANGTISFGGGTLQFSPSNTTDYSSRFSTAISQVFRVNTNSQNVTLATGLSSTGGSFIKSGAGILTLTGASSFDGGTSVSAGTILLSGGNDRLSTFGNISIATADDFHGIDLGANTQNTSGNVTVGRGALSNGTINLTGSGTYLLNGKANLSANLQGATAAVSVNNLGNVATLSGNNTYGGGTTITGATSTLNLGSATALGTGGLSFDGGILGSNGNLGNVTINNAFTVTGSNAYRLVPGDATTLIITSNLAGGVSNDLRKGGAGFITLSGNNTYGGVTSISRGTLSATSLADGGSTSGIGSSSNAASNLLIGGSDSSNPSTLAYVGTSAASTDRLFTAVFGPLGSSFANNAANSAHTLTFSNTGAIAFSGVGVRTIGLGGTNTGENSFALQISNEGANATSFTKRDAGKWILSGANTYTGVTNLAAGTLSVSSLGNGGAASNIGQSSNAVTNLLIGNGGTLRYTGAVGSTDRLFTLNGTSAGHSFTLDASGSGAINFTNSGSLAYGTTNQSRILNLNGTNTGDNALAATLTNNGSGSTSVTKNDAGTWLLTGASSHTGVTTVNGGTLAVGNIANGSFNSALGASSNAPNQLLLGNGTTLRYTGAAASTDRRFTVNGVANGQGAKIEASGMGAVNFTNGTGPSWGTTNQTRTLTLGGTNTASNTFSGAITNNGTAAVSVTKADAGQWVLTGTNLYTGTTTVTAGTLSIGSTGSLASGSVVTVDINGTLAGSGTIGGATVINGTHAVGTSAGLQAFSNNLTYGSTSIFSWELASNTDTSDGGVRGTDYDAVNVGGILSADPGAVFRVVLTGAAENLDGIFWESAQSWTNIFSNAFDVGGFTTANLQVYQNGTAFTPTNGSFSISGGDLSWSAVPEPSNVLIGSVLGAALLRRRRFSRSLTVEAN